MNQDLNGIIAPVQTELLISELTKDKFVRTTNKANNELYIITAHDSPNVMREIARLREITFRMAGGGTAKSIDIDDYDTAEKPYKQLIVWSPSDKQILGGYRFIIKDENSPETEEINLATAKYFKFSDEFKKNYVPYTIELGRSFIAPDFQGTGSSKRGLFTLDNLWDGLGALMVNYPHAKYFFGKVTMYKHYNTDARNILLYFLNKHFSDTDNLVTPYKALQFDIDEDYMNSIFIGENYLEDYKILSKKVRELGENVPPLINAYMNLSSTMKVFGTVSNTYFGDVEETSIMITIDDIYNAKKERHISGYTKK